MFNIKNDCKNEVKLMRVSIQHKKSQAAMEFLMTYGWAILVVLAAIAALAYFGVLSPEKFLPQKCILVPGLACQQQKVEPTKITLVIAQSLGRTITVTSIDVAGCSSAFNQDMQTDTTHTFEVGGTCSNGAVKEKFKGEITLNYVDKEYNITKTARGSINSQVE